MPAAREKPAPIDLQLIQRLSDKLFEVGDIYG